MSERRVLVNENSLIAIGSAIREKNGTDASYKPGDMAAAILEIQTGIEPTGDITITENGEYDVVNYAKAIVDVAGSGGGDFEIPVITGDCSYRFAYDGWTWVVEAFGDQMRTEDITNCLRMFDSSENLTEIPFEINCKEETGINCNNMFGYSGIVKLPKINNCKISNAGDLFSGCYYLQEISEDFVKGIDWSGYDTTLNGYNYYILGSTFSHCYSLRSVPMDLISHENQFSTGKYNQLYYQLFNYCKTLDEVIDLPINNKHTSVAQTTDLFCNTFQYCRRLKNMTFKSYEPGRQIKWKSQVIDLSKYVGYMSGDYDDTSMYNSGITKATKVVDDATYQALKDNPDWYSAKLEYSRYNHDSAVRTINSLPDTSAYLAAKGGTNTIKFTGAAGALTDGGAINTMTEEEIAVAAAKGWTVSFV